MAAEFEWCAGSCEAQVDCLERRQRQRPSRLRLAMPDCHGSASAGSVSRKRSSIPQPSISASTTEPAITDKPPARQGQCDEQEDCREYPIHDSRKSLIYCDPSVNFGFDSPPSQTSATCETQEDGALSPSASNDTDGCQARAIPYSAIVHLTTIAAGHGWNREVRQTFGCCSLKQLRWSQTGAQVMASKSPRGHQPRPKDNPRSMKVKATRLPIATIGKPRPNSSTRSVASMKFVMRVM